MLLIAEGDYFAPQSATVAAIEEAHSQVRAVRVWAEEVAPVLCTSRGHDQCAPALEEALGFREGRALHMCSSQGLAIVKNAMMHAWEQMLWNLC